MGRLCDPGGFAPAAALRRRAWGPHDLRFAPAGAPAAHPAHYADLALRASNSRVTLRRGLVTICALAAIPLLAQQPSSAQAQPAPTFKVGVEYVEVDAVVTDRTGNIARGLTQDDFKISEDGKPQTITSFSFVDVPSPQTDQRPARTAAITPDVASNAHPFEGRMYVAVIDDLEIEPNQTGRAAAAADRFVRDDLGPDDVMAVIHTMGGARSAEAEFTGDKQALLAAIQRGGGLSLHDNGGAMTPEIGMDLDAERAHAALAALQTVGSVAAWFSTIRNRRKAILFFSEGINYNFDQVFASPCVSPDIMNPGGELSSPPCYAEDVVDGMNRLIAAAARENVAIYGIDPRGQANNRSEQDIIEPGRGHNEQHALDQLQRAQDSLRIISDRTGGFAVVNTNSVPAAYRRIVADSSSYYVLAYYPNDKRDGRFHKIQVRVDRPGLTVRARHGYVAPIGKRKAASGSVAATADIAEALNTPIPISGLTLTAFAAPFRDPVVTVGAAPDASVLLGLELHGRDLPLTAGEHILLSYVAIDDRGKTHGARSETITLNLEPKTKARVAEGGGVRVLNRIALAPGHYQVRVAARDEASAKVGSVLCSLDVPDFGKPPLALSGIILTADPGEGMPTAAPDGDPRPANRLPAPPIGLRAFTPDQVLVVYAEAYDNQKVASPSVGLTTAIVARDGRAVSNVEGQRVPGAPGGAFGFTARVPMRDLPVGHYLLNVEAQAQGGATATRRIPFSVVALPGATGPLAMASR